MKKILFLFLCIICFCGCEKEKENVIEDYEKPILTISPTSGLFQNSVKITITASDNISGLADDNSYLYCLNDSEESFSNCNWNSYINGEEFEISGSNPKQYLWIYPIKDKSGNISGDSSEILPYLVGSYSFDSSVPKITISDSSNSGENVDTPTDSCTSSTSISISVSDEGTGLSDENKYQYYMSTSDKTLEGGQWNNYQSGETINFNMTDGAYRPGIYYLWLYPIKDLANNVNDSQTFDTPYYVKEIKLNYTKCYDYTGNFETFVVPNDGNYKIEAWGAQGAGIDGGQGGYTSGILNMKRDESYFVYVGGTNGYNGGGQGCSPNFTGGGATDIRLVSGVWNDNKSLNSRIMIAGGGGGNEYNNMTAIGHGGGLKGLDGIPESTNQKFKATGGTQTSGGKVTNYNVNFSLGTNGSYGQGGKGGCDSKCTSFYCGGSYGGGGGLYGGAGGSRLNAGRWGGAGGSSYISGHIGCVSVTSESNNSPKQGCSDGNSNVSCSHHYSGKIFTDTVMISGNNSMPSTKTEKNEIGHLGNGFLKITYVD